MTTYLYYKKHKEEMKTYKHLLNPGYAYSSQVGTSRT